MAEYIEREALPQKRERGFFLDDYFNAGWNACLNNIESIPAADVVSGGDFRDCVNELCLRCGQYQQEHLGACDGCRWLKARRGR